MTRFGLVVMGLWFLAFNVYQEAHWLPMAQMNDFHYFYAAAQIGVSHGWGRIYDPQLSRMVIAASCPNAGTEPFLYPPLDAWLAVPLIAVPCMAAYVVFALLGLGLLVVAALLIGGRDRLERLCLVLSAVAFLPTYTAFAAGQVSPLVTLALVLAWCWLRQDRQLAAGLVLTTILLKPQLGLLVPVALLAAGYTRAFRIWTIATLAILMTFVLALGRGGIEQWISNELLVYWGSTYEQRWSLAHLLGPDIGLVADLAAVAAMLVIARLSHGRGPEVPLAVGVATTFLVAYHLTPPDFVVLLVPVWILAMERSRVGVAAAVLGWLAAWFAVGLAVPVILFECAVLGLCAAWARRSGWTGDLRPGAVDSLPSVTRTPT